MILEFHKKNSILWNLTAIVCRKVKCTITNTPHY